MSLLSSALAADYSATDGWVTYENLDSGYKLRLPPDWKPVVGHGDGEREFLNYFTTPEMSRIDFFCIEYTDFVATCGMRLNS
jgi:hypothetical protein